MTEAPGSRLDSWKEIAEYLGRNVRTVTRWADERGLPVHRLPGGKRSAVFAFRHEIDAWLDQRGGDPHQSPGLTPAGGGNTEATASSPTPQSAAVQQHRSTTRRVLLRGGVAAGALAVASIAIALALRSSSSQASGLYSVQFGADTLEAHDAQGRTLWTHRYPEMLLKDYFERLPGDHQAARIADFFHDGNKEVAAIVPLRGGPNADQIVQTEVDFFSGTGKLLWKYDPEKAFRFGSHELKDPWGLFDLFVGGDETQTTLWATASHHMWGNAFVAQLDPRTGRDTLRFVNTGALYRLSELRTSAGTFLLAGGFNNEWDGGNLAIINENKPFAASPQTPGSRHFCESCLPGEPDYYFVFPRSEINRGSGIYQNPVFRIEIADEGLEIIKYERFTLGPEATIYLLSPQPPFTLVSLRYDSRYDMLHRAWSAEGKLSHSLENCPERLHPQPVRLWTPSGGWTQLPVRPGRADQ